MIFAIRDDDINYFTRLETLERVYRNIWDTVPVSLAVIPFVAPHEGFAPERFRKNKIYPIGENRELADFIRKKISENSVSIMLHGYSHISYGNHHEFDVGEDLEEKVRKGKQYLEELFDVKIKTFVAPNHSFSKRGMEAVIKSRLNIAGSPQIKKHPLRFRIKNLRTFKTLLQFRLSNRPGLRYPFPVDFGDHKELYCYGLISKTTLDELKQGLSFSHKKNGVFCLATHSRAVNERMLNILEEITELARGLGNVEFSTVDNVFTQG
jgi:hypothetical protein